jgi:hypothetical protein
VRGVGKRAVGRDAVHGVLLDQAPEVLGVHGLVLDQIDRELVDQLAVAYQEIFDGVVGFVGDPPAGCAGPSSVRP